MNGTTPTLALGAAAGRGGDSGRALFWRLIWIYNLASLVAVIVTLLLAMIGLEFTGQQWGLFWIAVWPTVAFYVSLDLIVISRQLRP
ncbi:MAG: hypothetical protein JSS35_05805, partial [Proteobacteria bacterium]|nr:hypothetical protein [Pseudomonadota bacterium]